MTEYETRRILLAFGVVVAFGVIMAFAFPDRQVPNPGGQDRIEVRQEPAQVAAVPIRPHLVQQAPVADHTVDVPSTPIAARLPQTLYIPVPRPETQRRYLGIDEEPVMFFDGRRGIMVRRVDSWVCRPKELASRLAKCFGQLTPTQFRTTGTSPGIANQTPGNILQLVVYSPLFDMNRFVPVDLTQYPR